MYSTDFRKRVENYSRMKTDQERVKSLIKSCRSIKKKLKGKQFDLSKPKENKSNEDLQFEFHLK